MDSMRILFTCFARIWRILPRVLRRQTFWLFLAMVAYSLLELAVVVSFSAFAMLLGNPESYQNSPMVLQLVAAIPALAPIVADIWSLILCAVLVPIAAVVSKNIVAAYVAWHTGLLGGEVAGYVGREIMRRFVHMPYDWHLSASSGEAFTKMSWRYALGQLLIQSMTAYSNAITAILLFIGLFVCSPELTLFVITTMGIASVILYMGIKKDVDCSSRLAANAQAEESSATMAAIRGIREVLIYQQQPAFLKSIDQGIDHGLRPQAFLQSVPAAPTWVLESMGFLLIGAALVWMVLVQQADRAYITSNLATLMLTAWRALPTINRTVGAVVNIRANQPMGIPCLEYMERLQDAPRTAEEHTERLSFRDGIKLENVSYRYPDCSTEVLRNVTLEIPKGSCVGIIGRSGAGKSTVINILSGLLQPTEGHILVDGTALSEKSLPSFRRNIGYVPQNPFIMGGTVEANIAFSEWGRPADRERVLEACRLAQIDFLEDAEGRARTVGENGAGLSGGQAQRVTIARALYAKPEVLIFDEATSSLDHRTEEELSKTISALPRHITRIVVAHKLTALKNCETVYWFKDGTVFRSGAAGQLLQDYQTPDAEAAA